MFCHKWKELTLFFWVTLSTKQTVRHWGLVSLYNTILLDLLNNNAPEKEQTISDRPQSLWISKNVIEAKPERRGAEGRKRKSGLAVDRKIYRHTK